MAEGVPVGEACRERVSSVPRALHNGLAMSHRVLVLAKAQWCNPK